ncbi:TIGR01777 family oxidoreductase [Porphyromonas sp. COT-239 OH1446]|uniref:TIGR01777 family oxidoreductase n=1 Tax=Porphyromonas sp. COT-239 OH1446 TaxID=1515613 RepID=UPI00052B67CC|nr:TIGR01777 family oxidoreductase [Porphyromonas sp. COT-239 OH1446]KGN71269.1 hypothetical protein HQ37_02110 [Porphyromonas sp. COT-239 OH1446]
MDTTIKPTTILLTGGMTLLGRRLTDKLRAEGYRVHWLTNQLEQAEGKCDAAFLWDIDRKLIDDIAFDGANVLIHLHGAQLFKERWSAGRKREIIRSRALSTRLLFNALRRTKHSIHSVLVASSVYYYPAATMNETFYEREAAGEDFLGQCHQMLEEEAQRFRTRLGIRTVILRNGIALDPRRGVLPNMSLPVSFGLNMPLGRGDQYINWIHIDDLCRIYSYAIANTELRGVYNACAPSPLTNSQFMYALCSVKGHDHLRLPISSVILRSLLGEMADPLLKSSRVSSDKLIASGFTFEYDSLSKALRSCLDR